MPITLYVTFVNMLSKRLIKNDLNRIKQDAEEKMIQIEGKYTTAKILTDTVEPEVIKQATMLCNHPLFENKKIVLQPDCHPSKATCVGLCAEIDTQHIIPQLLGNDIYCSVSIWLIKGKQNDYSKLDKVIKNMKTNKPSIIREIENKITKQYKINIGDVFGTIGGGNHFISVEEGQTGNYLIIHSGSRTIGKQIGIYYSDLALQQNPYKGGEEKQLSWLNPESSIEYMSTMLDITQWVRQNHSCIAYYICKQMKWEIADYVFSPHNYIDLQNKILHKGSIKLAPGEFGVIPINMADGTLLVYGKYGEDINYEINLGSAPHGAGRLLSRQESKEKLNMKDYRQRMKNIYSSNVNVSTIDESPMAYKPIEQIKQDIESYCNIVDHLIPVYNFK